MQTSTDLSKNFRSKNWTIQEDEQLCKSWIAISNDPIVGRDQKTKTFWRSVHKDFSENMSKYYEDNPQEERIERPARGIDNRWRNAISKAVNKFFGYHQQVINLNKDGSTAATHLTDALKMYRSLEKKKFTLSHCYYILREDPMWRVDMQEKKATKSKSREVAYVNNGAAVATSTAETRTSRPAERKQAKATLQQKRDVEGMYKVIKKNQERLISNSEEKLELMKTLRDFIIMKNQPAEIKDAYFAARYAEMQEGWKKAQKAKTSHPVVEKEAVEAEMNEAEEVDEKFE